MTKKELKHNEMIDIEFHNDINQWFVASIIADFIDSYNFQIISYILWDNNISLVIWSSITHNLLEWDKENYLWINIMSNDWESIVKQILIYRDYVKRLIISWIIIIDNVEKEHS